MCVSGTGRGVPDNARTAGAVLDGTAAICSVGIENLCDAALGGIGNSEMNI